MSNPENEDIACCSKSVNCCDPSAGQTDASRRVFLKLAGGGLAATLADWGLFASTAFGQNGEVHLIPSDKKLDPAWIRSLFERGEAEVYSGDELKYIGMPVGGIACGQVYIGGDGKLWAWDIFNKPIATTRFNECDGIHYKGKPEPHALLDQGFAIQVKADDKVWKKTLDKDGFKHITFRGEYPIATINYQDESLPVAVKLEAFSPFIPLRAKDSAIPATVMSFRVENTSDQKVEVSIAGWLENAVRRFTAGAKSDHRANQWRTLGKHGLMTCSWIEAKRQAREKVDRPRKDIVLEDFEGDFSGWTVEGDAFGKRPASVDKVHGYALSGAKGKQLALSHRRNGKTDSQAADARTGQLTSPIFTLKRKYIQFLIAGGSHADQTCVQLLVEGETVQNNLGNPTEVLQSVNGANSTAMRTHYFDVSSLQGKKARLRIVDSHQGGWGHVAVDHIILTDAAPLETEDESVDFDHGTMALMLISGAEKAQVNLQLPTQRSAQMIFNQLKPLHSGQSQHGQVGEALVGGMGQTRELEPGQSTQYDFVITWHFSSVLMDNWKQDWIWPKITSIESLKRHYAKHYTGAAEAAMDVAKRFGELTGTTRRWRDTWYDSTLPYWFLDRTMIPTDCLATQTCAWFDNGRFYGWEGTYCCGGTCTHVWHYAQAMGRLFPELERSVREHVDFNPKTGQTADGGIRMRGELGTTATDGHCGRILGVYREHLVSKDDAFLKKLWPQIKKSLHYLIREDGNKDGVLEGEQHNTLDAAWYGVSSWLSSLHIAAMKAGAAMAQRMGDKQYARHCDLIARRGGRELVKRVFNDEYFIHQRDPSRPNANGSGNGCEIDQVQGQSWAHQVGLDRILPEKETRQSLNSLWKYNYTPDVGPYRKQFTKGRWYAMPGEGGLLMCTFPKGDADNLERGNLRHAAYFNECMTGFEYQVASHMIFEGAPDLVEKGLAIIRTIHDRYAPSRRNPYNEVECSDHYARAMSVYGAFIAVCGFEYDGPAGRIGFAPRLTPENFKAPFTAAEGWGTFSQRINSQTMEASIEIKMGKLSIQTLALSSKRKVASAMVNGRLVRCTQHDQRIVITLTKRIVTPVDEPLVVKLAF